jgi:hypothetical protein
MHNRATRRQFLATAATAAAAMTCDPRLLAQDAKPAPNQGFRAGAHAIDITPEQMPVIVNGGFTERSANRVTDRLHARCLVLDDGTTRLAIAVVDNCLIPQPLIDEAKRLASQATGIPEKQMLVSATHTHSAPAAVAILGSRADEAYVKFLPGQIAEGIRRAAANLAPAKIGWTTIAVPEGTSCRRWITRPDRAKTDPFGEPTVRAMMHPGFQNPDYVAPAGPADPGLSLLAVQSPEGRPIALLANYSMHYHGASPVSADYYGAFAEEIQRHLGADGQDPPFVAIMSQGTSGDLHNRDYDQPKFRWDKGLLQYAQAIAEPAIAAYKTITYRDSVSLAAAERTMTLRRRVPGAERLAWAKQLAAKIGDRLPKTQPEIYALEAIYLHNDPVRTFKLQALRIGELGIAAIPCEVFGITGLKLKAQSPLLPTINFELANGYEGYIPPPEQHKLGGYTTWPARSAALEETAEPQIVEAMLSLLEEVAGKPRRKVVESHGTYAQAVLAAKPAAYWRMSEFQGPVARDSSGNQRDGRYEDGVAFYLDGPASDAFCGPGVVNRCAHFAGGRMLASVQGLGPSYSVEFWCWNGLPSDARPVTGYLFARATEGQQPASSECLAIAGTAPQPGRLMFSSGQQADSLCGGPEIKLRTWHHVVLVRDGLQVTVYLDGKPCIQGTTKSAASADASRLFFGGRFDQTATFEGKIDEVAVYARAIGADEVAQRFAAGCPSQDVRES